jgi:hypothetical protein
VAADPGAWFVLNARDAPWYHIEGRPALCVFEAETGDFLQFGLNLNVLWPERPLRQWDLVHCPAGTKHVIVGAGDGPSVVLAVGARRHSTGPDWGGYPVEPAALRHGAGVEEETTEPEQAYARFVKRKPTRYREGWLPG